MQPVQKPRTKWTSVKGGRSAVHQQQQPEPRKSVSGNDLSIGGTKTGQSQRLGGVATTGLRSVAPRVVPNPTMSYGRDGKAVVISRPPRPPNFTGNGSQTKSSVEKFSRNPNPFLRMEGANLPAFKGHLHTDFERSKEFRKAAVRLKKPGLAVSETKKSFNREKTQHINLKKLSNRIPPSGSNLIGNFYNGASTSPSKIPLSVNSVSTPAISGYRNYNPCLLGTGATYGGSGDSATMLAAEMNRKGDLTLGDQKRMQWAKERDEAGLAGGGPGEEQNGLWSPWGRPSGDSKSSSAIYGSQQPSNVVPASYVTKLGLQSQAHAGSYSQSDCYLPPINASLALAQQSHSHQHQKSTTWAITNKDENYNNANYNDSSRLVSRKSSLPNFSHGDGYHHPREGHMSQSYHNEVNNAEVGGGGFFANKSNGWSSLQEPEVGYHTSGYQSENNNDYQHQLNTNGDELPLRKLNVDGGHYIVTDPRSDGFPRSSDGRSPRVILHKIFMDPNNGPSRGESEYVVNAMSNKMSASQNSYANLDEVKRSYGGSTGYLNKPPPVAMRSSLTIGLDSSYGNSFKDLEKKEKEQWLNELEKQREEQRLRKLMDKDDKRARWGDRGIGVGHFWEPADSSNARLPPTPNSRDGRDRDDRGMAQGSPTPPAWLERSLSNMQHSSKSQPNLLQEQFASDGVNSNLFINQSSSDLRNRTGISPENGDNGERTFIRGQNVPIDPDSMAEKEKRRQANQEHLEAIKEQIADRQRKLKEEKERQMLEDKEQEQRMAHQRELELKRLDMEKRKRMCHLDSVNDNIPDIPVEIRESGKVSRVSNSRRNQDEDPPLIPHQVINQPDAYELEIARRQSILLTSSTDESQRIGTASLTDFREESGSAKSVKVDQSLMTDSDHLYERTLTPTKARSHSVGRSKEFGTQTEMSDTGLTSEDKSSAKSRSHNSLSDGKSKSKNGNMTKKKTEEKPRWGSNPVKKQYLKQSEKDPNYQQRMKRRQERTIHTGGETGTDESEDQNQNIPFSRIRSRMKIKSPTKAQGPLKALHFKTETRQKTKTKETSQTQKSTLIKNFKSDPQLNKDNLPLNGVVRRNLGSIGGLNSVGTSEESGSGFTSPSLFQRNTNSGSNSGSLGSQSHPSPDIPEYIPSFSKEFVLQRDFDELPINAGKIAPGFQKVFGGQSETQENVDIPKPKVERAQPPQTKKAITALKPKPPKVLKNPRKETKPVEEDLQEEIFPSVNSPPKPPPSPPVPALMNKIKLGLRPDENGRMSSLSPEILSPIPNVPIGSRLTPIPNRMSSAAPKIDIDIAVTSASNPDLQRILEEAEEQDRRKDSTDTDSSANYQHFKLPYIAPEVLTSRSSRGSHLSRPMTRDSELSMQIQEDFILDLMSQKEVQDQLSARESELSEKGIIEFNIRLPSSWGRNGSSNGTKKQRLVEEYRDPLISDRRKATADWLRRMDDSPKEAILTNLSSLKQGIRKQQTELDLTQARTRAYAVSTDEE